MGKKYFATVMNKHYLGLNTFIFNAIYVIEGEVDSDSKVFVDQYGHEYFSMMDESYLMSEIPYAYSNLYAKSDIEKVFGVVGRSLEDAIKKYESLAKDMFYYVSKTEGNDLFCYLLNRRELEQRIVGSLIKTGADNIKMYEPRQDQQNVDSNNVEIISKLVENIIGGSYSLNDLKNLREHAVVNLENLEGLIDTLDLQIEASEKGESSVELSKVNKIINQENVSYDSISILDNDIDVDDLFKKITQTLVAQDEPIRRMLIEIVRREMDPRKRKEAILLTGSTGVGKTELMELIAKYLDKPFIKVDATQLTIPGYVGKNLEEVLWDLYVSCDNDINRTQNAIVYFDEIDKKASPNKSDISGQGVLNTLLPFITGSSYDACVSVKSSTNKVKIDTSNMLVVLGGAYTDVYKNLVDKSIGFSPSGNGLNTIRVATVGDFIDKAMMTDEFMSRVVIIKMNDLDVDNLKRVMLISDKSALKIQQSLFEKLGTTLIATDTYLHAIASEAYERGTGARGLNAAIDETTWRPFDDVYCNRGKYEKVILSEETVKNPKDYQLVKKRK